jgi:type II secretory pathway component GspD/PulD (secretin)
MRCPSPTPSALPWLALTALLTLTWTSVSAQAQNESTPEATASPTQAVQLAPLPDTEQFNQPIELRTRPAGESLDALIQILARSVGLSAITQGIPADTVVRYDLGEPKPFREVWDIVLTLNGLEYVLRDNNLVVVGPPEALAGLRRRQTSAPNTVTRTYRVSVGSDSEAGGAANDSGSLQELANYLKGQFPPNSGFNVTAFEQLGLLSVQATPPQQDRVVQLLGPFTEASEERVRRTYALSYARAEEIAEILKSSQGAVPATPDIRTTTSSGSTEATTAGATSTDSTTTASTPGTSAQAAVETAFAEGDLAATPDPRTNRVIVFASERVQSQVAELIAELDQPERQVNVQVRIQEVTSDVTERLGMDLTAAVGNFTTTLFSGDETSGLGFIFDAQRAISGFNLGAVLDAFERQGLSRRVDDSNITVLNNGEASLQAGGTIFISIPGGEQNIERTIPYGVQIDLNPQITNNNEVILGITGRVEAVLSDTNDPSFLELSTRNLTSRVSLRPGQTVVLGGLLQNELTDTTRSVPGLGSIPVVGNLFTTNSSVERNTELLVIVTANVLE